jgi:hypothetical protein
VGGDIVITFGSLRNIHKDKYKENSKKEWSWG